MKCKIVKIVPQGDTNRALLTVNYSLALYYGICSTSLWVRVARYKQCIIIITLEFVHGDNLLPNKF